MYLHVIMCPTLYFCLIIHYYNVYINNTWLMYMYFHFFFPIRKHTIGDVQKADRISQSWCTKLAYD